MLLKKLILPFLLLAGTSANAAQGDFLVKGRFSLTFPTDHGNNGPVEPDITAGSLDFHTASGGELELAYFLTDDLALSASGGLGTHAIHGADSLSTLERAGSARAMPLIATLQYHFMPDAPIRPYAGVGIGYTRYTAEKTTTALDTALGGASRLSLDNSLGLVLQSGVDIDITTRLFLNMDVKYVDMGSVAVLTTGPTTRRVTLDLDPIIAGVGLGMRF